MGTKANWKIQPIRYCISVSCLINYTFWSVSDYIYHRLSITKWIQLHNGDKGLKAFFKKVYDSLAPGGTFVLEPQDFDTFQRRAKKIDVRILDAFSTWFYSTLCIFLLAFKRCWTRAQISTRGLSRFLDKQVGI